MKIYKKTYFFIMLIIGILSLIMLYINSIKTPLTYKSYIYFIQDKNNNRISEIYLTNSSTILVQLKNNSKYQTDNPRNENFKEELLNSGIKVNENKPIALNILIPSITLILSISFILFYLIKWKKIPAKGMLSVDALNINEATTTAYSFENVAGNEEAKESVKDIVDFLKSPEKYKEYGARMPKGIILYGEPGTGKTLLAKAIAGEANVPFYAMSGSDFIQVYVGVGASRIRQLFKKAKKNGKAVIFIDEIDAIGKKRSNSKNGGSEEKDQTLNALLTEMSGFNDSEGIIVLAATNRLDMLDNALLRPGRFDRHIEISLPDVFAREKILQLHLDNKPYNNINIKNWAHKTVYFSGAKIENLINEAAILACKDNSKFISDMHVDKAYSIILTGHEKINRGHIRELDNKITAYHEAGHALVSSLILPEEEISKISIIPSTNGAGGYTMSIPKDTLYQNKAYLENKIQVLLGGRAAEEIIFGEDNITTGAFSDLKSSTKLIMNMLAEYGMGKSLGLLNLNEISEFNIANNENLIQEAKNLIENLYNETKNFLKILLLN